MFYFFVNKKRLLVLFITIIAVLFAMVLFINHKKSGVLLNTKEKRVAFINSLGYKVDESLEETKNIVIPKKFSKVYKNYNDLQIKNGFNLEKYKGAKVVQYTLKIKSNTPTYAHILLYKGHLIGGDISSVNLNGFMKGLKNASW